MNTKFVLHNFPDKRRASRRKTIKGPIGENCCYYKSFNKGRLDPSRKSSNSSWLQLLANNQWINRLQYYYSYSSKVWLTLSVFQLFNRNSIGIKCSLIVLGGGGGFTMSLFWPPYWSKVFKSIFLNFELKL